MEKILECVMLTAFDYALLILLLHDREHPKEICPIHLTLVGTMGVGLLVGTVGKLTVRPVEATAAFYLVGVVLSVAVLINLLYLKRHGGREGRSA